MRMNKLNILHGKAPHHSPVSTMFGIGGQTYTYLASFSRRHTCGSGIIIMGKSFFYLCGLRTCFLRLMLREVPTMYRLLKLAHSLVPSAKPVSCFFIISHILLKMRNNCISFQYAKCSAMLLKSWKKIVTLWYAHSRSY